MSYKSKATIFGLPLVHISGSEPAVGFIAIGQIAYGFITLGQFGVGIIFGLGQFMAGVISIAQFSFGALFSIGQFSLGWHSLGAPSFGYEGMFGFHFVEKNFLSGFMNLNGVVFAAVYFILFVALLVPCNYLFSAVRAGFAGRTASGSAPALRVTKRSRDENPRLSPLLFARIALVFISMFAAWQVLHVARFDRVFDEDKLTLLKEKGKAGTAVVLDVHAPFLQFGEKTLLLDARVSPVNTEIDPYKAEIIVAGDVDYSFEEGMKIRVRYDPARIGEVVFAGGREGN